MGHTKHAFSRPSSATISRATGAATLLAASLLLGAAPARAQEGEGPPGTMRPVLRGRQAAVSSMRPEATEAARSILQAGGNAFDAVVAGQAALAVSDFALNGVGADAVILVYDAKAKKVVSINAEPPAPQAGDDRVVPQEQRRQDPEQRRPAVGRVADRGRRLVPAARSLGHDELRTGAAAGPRAGRTGLPDERPPGALDRQLAQDPQISLHHEGLPARRPGPPRRRRLQEPRPRPHASAS